MLPSNTARNVPISLYIILSNGLAISEEYKREVWLNVKQYETTKMGCFETFLNVYELGEMQKDFR